ncbi:MAG: matrixin family metalloprotease [Cyanobacteria bacterium J06634_5]
MTSSTTLKTIKALPDFKRPKSLSQLLANASKERSDINTLVDDLIETVRAQQPRSSANSRTLFRTNAATPIATQLNRQRSPKAKNTLGDIAKLGDLAPRFWGSTNRNGMLNGTLNGRLSDMINSAPRNTTFAMGPTNSTAVDTSPAGCGAGCGCSVCTGQQNGAAFTTSRTGGGSGAPRKWSQPNGKGSAIDVTYAFANNLNIPGLSKARAKALFVDALKLWSNYAPLNFKEVADTGDGRTVDIRVGSNFIDGPSNTLAFAYFPGGGDITFDTGENWRESLFLETAVHELGHSLGLGHETQVSAIMNPTIANRFSNRSEFLLQDDINGIRSLYGNGKGSVRTLGQPSAPAPAPAPTPTPKPAPAPSPSPSPKPSDNLVTNGSFENNSVRTDSFAVFNRVNGWRTLAGSGIQIEKRTAFGAAADGNAWAELDSYSNSIIAQDVDTLTGASYQLSFDYSPRQGLSSNTNGIQVYWDGKLLETITANGRSQNSWRTFKYDVKGSSRPSSMLAFRAVGRNDQVGGFIDDVVVSQKGNFQELEATAGLSEKKEDGFLQEQSQISAIASNTESGAFNPLA